MKVENGLNWELLKVRKVRGLKLKKKKVKVRLLEDFIYNLAVFRVLNTDYCLFLANFFSCWEKRNHRYCMDKWPKNICWVLGLV